MQHFDGRVIAITGGASGIGLALARRFGAEGMKVAIGDVEEDALARVGADLAAAGVEVFTAPLDVTDPAQMDAFADATLDRFGAVHVFANNAGVGGGGLSWEAPLATWEWVLGVNLWGVIHGLRTFVPILLEQDEAHIVNTASVAGLVAAPYMAPYNASKHAVVAISESMHHEFAITGAKARVSVLCPGWVNTGIATSERNRPAHLDIGGPQSVEDRQQAEVMSGVLAQMIANGMDPAVVADKVFAAVRDEQFWILTHCESPDDQWTQAVTRRLDSVRDGTNPALNLLV